MTAKAPGSKGKQISILADLFFRGAGHCAGHRSPATSPLPYCPGLTPTSFHCPAIRPYDEKKRETTGLSELQP